MQFEPALVHRVLDARAKLWTACLQCVEERRADLLDVDAAVLDRLDGFCELDQLARRGLWLCVRTVVGLVSSGPQP